jgi:hypothetical protein
MNFGDILSLLLGATPMPYDRQNEIRKELDARTPPWLRGGPQNTVRQIVFNQRLHGKTFDESVEIAVAFVRQTNPNFTPEILPSPAQS